VTRQAQKIRHPFKDRILALAAASTVLLTISADQALASEPKDRVICTTEPRSTWMSETEARRRFNADSYLLLRFKISSENCHEFYAIEHGGTVVEAYVHPITGEVVRLTRIPLPRQNMPKGATPSAAGQ